MAGSIALPTASAARWSGATIILLILEVAIFSLEFSIFTATHWWAFPQFIAAATFLFLLPGSVLTAWWRLPLSPIEWLVVSVCLGMAATAALYGVLLWAGTPDLLWVWIMYGATRLRQGPTIAQAIRTGRHRIQRTHFLLLLALAAGWSPLFLVACYFRNLVRATDGAVLHYTINSADVSFHTALAGELSHGLHPQIPYIAGQVLSYHVGMDLITAIFARFGGLAIPDLVVRFCPLFFVTFSMLAAFCLARRFIGSGGAGVAAAALAILGEDLSFIPGILQGDRHLWDVDYLQVPTMFSSYDVNPMVLGIGFLFAGLFCLERASTDRRRGWVAAATLCFAALVEIKIFLFLQIELALAIAAVVDLATRRRLAYARLGLYILLAALPIEGYAQFANRHGGQITWNFSPRLTHYVRPAIDGLHLPGLMAYPVVALVVYLVASLGFRVIGAGALIRSLRPSAAGAIGLPMAIFVLVGPILTLSTKIVPRDFPDTYDNAVWFYGGSKFLAALFAVAAVARVWPKLGRRVRVIAALLIVAASLPSSLDYVVKTGHHQTPGRWSPATMAAVAYLARAAAPGDVALPLSADTQRLLMTMTSLRLPYAEDFPYIAFASRQELAARQRDLDLFRQSWASGRVRADILDKYGVRWLVVAHGLDQAEIATTASAPANEAPVSPVFGNREIVIYRIKIERPTAERS